MIDVHPSNLSGRFLGLLITSLHFSSIMDSIIKYILEDSFPFCVDDGFFLFRMILSMFIAAGL